MKPYEQIVICNLEGSAPLGTTMVIKIPPTIAEHNVMTELLKRIRSDFPGAWYCVEQWARTEYAKSSGHVSTSAKIDQVAQAALGKMKVVTREHLGLPPDDPVNIDVPL